jgi:hypothetical protein
MSVLDKLSGERAVLPEYERPNTIHTRMRTTQSTMRRHGLSSYMTGKIEEEKKFQLWEQFFKDFSLYFVNLIEYPPYCGPKYIMILCLVLLSEVPF